METVDIIARCAEVPSFSSYEERLHPLVLETAGLIPSAEVRIVPHNNIVITVPGRAGAAPVVLTAHLDKINHFSRDCREPLIVARERRRLVGQLDDAAGVGVCLGVALRARKRDFPPLRILLSEMEEGTGPREHPFLLRDGGAGLYGGMGAKALATDLIERGEFPALTVTVDTTPFFRGRPGVALYCNHWELNQITPTPQLVAATEELKARFRAIDPDLAVLNNGNDYLMYGRVFAERCDAPIPSVAIEPGIFPYHQLGEGVFYEDIARVESILVELLQQLAAG